MNEFVGQHAARCGLHTSNLGECKADLVTVKELLGHAGIKYAHINREAKASVVRRLVGRSDKPSHSRRSGTKTAY